MEIVLAVALAVAVGVVAYLVVAGRRVRIDQGSGEQLLARLQAEVARLQGELNERAVAALSEQARTALAGQQEVAAQQLKGRQEQIDASLKVVREELERLRTFVGDVDRRQAGALEELRTVAVQGAKQTELLRQETARLKEVLGGNQSRGQWAERMADDVLRLAGMVEGVQYLRQQQVSGGTRPDFSFLLEGGVLHMDVKAPLVNFQRYLEATEEREREAAAKAFCRDLRARIDEVAGRNYISPQDGTVEFALMFIPSEQIFAFIHEREPTLLDYALERRVVVCSPLTLFAVLRVIQQTLRAAQLNRRADEVIAVLQAVQREWEAFREQLETLGKRLESATQAYERLATTRARRFEKELGKVDLLALEAPEPDDRALPSGE